VIALVFHTLGGIIASVIVLAALFGFFGTKKSE
jgi:hypothetical protein